MIVHKNQIKDIFRIFFWYPFRYLVQLLPSVCIHWLGGMMGTVDYFVSGRKRVQKIRKNISTTLEITEKNAEIVARRSFQNHLRNMLELMKYPKLNKQRLSGMVNYEGLDILDNALKNGKGIILLTAHFGAKQLLQVALGHKGYPLNQINFHMDEKELTYIQRKISQRQRINIEKKIPVKFIDAKSFMRPIFKCLKNNEVLIIAGDGIGLKRHMDLSSCRPFDFLGKKMLFPVNYFHLAKKTGALIIPVFVIRKKNSHRIIFNAALDTDSDKNVEAVNEFIRALELNILTYPSLWEFWEEFDEENLLV